MKIRNFMLIFMIFMVIVGFMTNINYAADPVPPDYMGTLKYGMKTISTADTHATSGGSKIVEIINGFIKLIQVAGSGVAVIVVTILGVKYMLASAGEKADIKKQAMPIVVGCVILFAAVNLVGIVASIGSGLNPKT